MCSSSLCCSWRSLLGRRPSRIAPPTPPGSSVRRHEGRRTRPAPVDERGSAVASPRRVSGPPPSAPGRIVAARLLWRLSMSWTVPRRIFRWRSISAPERDIRRDETCGTPSRLASVSKERSEPIAIAPDRRRTLSSSCQANTASNARPWCRLRSCRRRGTLTLPAITPTCVGLQRCSPDRNAPS